MARIGVQPTWGTATERFGDSGSQPLASTFDRLSLDDASLEPLRAAAATLRAITSSPTLPVSLGRLQVVFDQSSVTTPITLEYGATRRLMLGVTAPYVQTRNEVYANPNPGRNEGTMGINPAFAFAGARTANGTVVSQLAEAATTLSARLAACQGSTAPSCSAINADRNGAMQLAAAANSVAQGIASVYGTATVNGARYAPVERSAVHNAVDARLTALSTALNGFLGAPSGRPAWVAARPVGAPLVGYADFTRIVTEADLGVGALPFETVEIRQLGDVELSAKLLLFDGLGGAVPQRVTPAGFRMRLAAGAVYRLGTGTPDDPDDFTDLPTGDGQNDIEGQLFVDLLFGRRFWGSAVARYGYQMADEQFRRIPSAPGEPFPALYRRQSVSRDLGDFVSLELTPRWALGDAVLVSGGYAYYRKAEDSHGGTFATLDLEGAPTTIDASALDAGSGVTYQRVLGALTYSTMSAYYEGRASLPLEVSYTLGRTVAGSGNVAATTSHALGLRIYARLFGGADSRPARPPRR